MDKLKELNCYFRALRPPNPKSNYIDYYYSGSYLEIDFPNTRCDYDKSGCCTMCNYGTGNPVTDINAITEQLLSVLEEYKGETSVLLIGTNGSVLDTKNFQFDILCESLKIINTFPYNTIIFETHFSTITRPVLQLLKKTLTDKEIFIEAGLESSNSFIQTYCYAKTLPLDFIKKKIDLIHESGMHVYINVILGAPFLSTKEQKQDCVNTVRWVIEHHCYAVIFPLNIKPFTTIEYMYQKEMYTPIFLWMLFDVLKAFSADELEYIDVTWYGNRLDEYVEDDCETIFPQTCDRCSNILQALFDQYNNLKNGSNRFCLLENFFKENKPCKCYETYLTDLSVTDDTGETEKSIDYLRKKLFCEAAIDGALTEDINAR